MLLTLLQNDQMNKFCYYECLIFVLDYLCTYKSLIAFLYFQYFYYANILFS